MKFYTSQGYGSQSSIDKLLEKMTAAELLALRGTGAAPKPPISIVGQSGARKAILTWGLPSRNADIIGWNIYRDTEYNLIQTIKDKNNTHCEVSLNSGATPPVTNIFVSSVSASGESAKIQVQVKAIAEAGAPVDPPPPHRDPPPADGGDGAGRLTR